MHSPINEFTPIEWGPAHLRDALEDLPTPPEDS